MIVAVVISLVALIASEWFGAARRRARARGLTMLSVDVEKKLGDFALNAQFEAQAA